jgi:branched-subunit amino acid transport protein AzlD
MEANMQLTGIQTLIMIFSIAFGAMLTRFLPFILFPENRKAPQFITYLGKVLPPAMMGLLVVYCLKGLSIVRSPHGIPEFISIAVIVVLHRWKNNVLLSIGAGTIAYMFLIQVVFS